MKKNVYELIGVGGGVFNLSLSLLLEEQSYKGAIFFERNSQIDWHPGLMLESSELQVSFMKDLILPVAPTSRYTFINYLHQRNLLYQFINRKTDTISRNQFQSYFRWVAENLPILKMGVTVEKINYNGEYFSVIANGEEHLAKSISIATGIIPNTPSCVESVLGEDVFHVSEYVRRKDSLTNKNIVVVGSGQSSAEVFSDLLSDNQHKSLSWLGRRYSFAQLEDNCFVNEFYAPSFVRIFKGLNKEKKKLFLDKMAMSCDGINQGLLDNIYRKIFERKFFADKEYDYLIRPNHELKSIVREGDGYRLTFTNLLLDESYSLTADKVILATGFQSASWELLRDLVADEYQNVDDLVFSDSFELQWKHMKKNRIFAQNTSKMAIGLADPNLSISAYRAAMIANSILGHEAYKTQPDTPMLEYI
ncbi:lysine N(6)-hydroxylase/L-ornithine N(5)-oxygenase family protein [Shewanella sp.]|uniref:lysine N(6)-hydroxylase/L-ornithine N(5)-oxygenase family protein n=1 Tax=Shewanella sp. TaxID=50422 RepID=UPI0040539AF3